MLEEARQVMHRHLLLVIYQSFIFPDAKASGLLKSP